MYGDVMLNWICNINNPFKGILKGLFRIINIFDKMESQNLIYYKLDLYTKMLTYFQGGNVSMYDWMVKFPEDKKYMSYNISELYHNVEYNKMPPNDLIKELQKEKKRLYKMKDNMWFNFRR